MKRNANLHCKKFEFQKKEWEWLKIQSYRQSSVNFRSCQKLSKRYFGPFQMERKISDVAYYKLSLSENSTIFIPVSHISLFKPFKGEIENCPHYYQTRPLTIILAFRKVLWVIKNMYACL